MYRVLLADDEKMSLIATEHSFDWEAQGFRVAESTTDALRASQALRRQRFDAAFLDIRMPGISGLEIIRQALAANIATSFVIVSGYTEFEYARKAVSYGVVEYCTKPVDEPSAPALLERLRKKVTASHLARDREIIGQLEDGRGVRQLAGWLGIAADQPHYLAAAVYADSLDALLRPLFAKDEITLLVNRGEAVKLAGGAEPLGPLGNIGEITGTYCRLTDIDSLPGALYWLQSAANRGSRLSLGTPELAGRFQPGFAELLKYLSDHSAEPLDLKQLAQRFSFNYTYCSELFPKNLGISFVQYLSGLRLRKAAELLLKDRLTIEEVACRAGFSDARYFENVFKKRYGMTPSQFRNRQKDEHP